MLRRALMILSGNAAASLLLLARNLIVARLIPVEDYGVAATFALVMALVEMASAFGLQQQIVQSAAGDEPRFQAALQGFQLFRGLVSGLVLFALAAPLARFLGIPQVIWAYQLLALVPVLTALQHFDIHRQTRQMRFGPMLWTGALPALASVLVIWPLAIWFGDWQIMLYSILVQAALGTLVSHLLAERPWRIVFDRAITFGALRFGWPLLANAVLMFAVFQGDRLIVGRELGMAALGVFSMGVTLTLTPTLILAKSVQNLMLPKLSEAQGDAEAFARIASLTFEITLFSSLCFFAGALLLGPLVTDLLLGPRFAALWPLIAVFALGQALRMLKAAPAIVALARGRTGNAAAANLLRAAALPVCWWVLSAGGTVETLLWILVLAEALSYGAALMLVPLADWRRTIPGHLVVAAALVAGSLWLLRAAPEPVAGAMLAPWWVWLACAAALAICLAALGQLRGYIWTRKGR
jgi:O-antigen/teichoic acid export membrane protein